MKALLIKGSVYNIPPRTTKCPHFHNIYKRNVCKPFWCATYYHVISRQYKTVLTLNVQLFSQDSWYKF